MGLVHDGVSHIMCTAISAGCHLPAIVCPVDGHCSWLPPPTQPHGGVCMRAPPSVLVAVCSLHAAATIVCLVVVLESHHCRRWLPPPTQPNGGVGVSHTCTTFSVGCRLLSACCRCHCLSYLLLCCREPSLPPLVAPTHPTQWRCGG